MVYSILTEARIKDSVAPKQPSSRQYQVVWDENRNLKGWTTFVNLDVVGAWNGFLFGTKRTADNGYIGPSSDFPPVDALTNDRIFFRLKYDKHPKNQNPTTFGKIQWTTTADPIFGDNKSITFDVIPDGKWRFYEIDMNQSPSWVGLVNRVRFFPCENGFQNDEFFLSFFEIGSNEFDFSFTEESAGTPGFAKGSKVLNESITIEKDVNDKLLVNIDDYGDVQITLSPQTATPLIIARDISLQLGKIGIGGYVRAEAFLDDDNRLRIESGTKASDSSVTITEGSNPAGFTLGFTNAVGEFIGTTGTGTDPAFNYEPLSAYRPTTLEILSLFDNDDILPAFSLDPQQYIVQAGRSDFAFENRRLRAELIVEGRGETYQGTNILADGQLDFQTKTLIDLNHPFTDEGEVEKIFMNGIPDQAGGTTKWKIFRPRLNGTIELIHEGVIGKKNFTDDPSGGLVGTNSPDVFVVDVSTQDIKVRRGDLLGIYNAGLHAGTGSSPKPDALYYEVAGDATGIITPPAPTGAGEKGLAIYARGSDVKNRAVIDIDLKRRLNIDTIEITGEEDTVDLEYNVATASSASFNVDTPGTHTICYNPSPILRVCFDRQNESFNVAALNDGVTLAENGVTGFGDGGPSGLGGADVAGATYFYVNGDAEFLDQFEFVSQSPNRFEFFKDPVGIDLFFSSTTPRMDKSIGKAILYFKEKRNMRSWQIEYFGPAGLEPASKSGYALIPEDSINLVKVDEKEIRRATLVNPKSQGLQSEILMGNPVVLDTIVTDNDGNQIREPQIGEDFDFGQAVDAIGESNIREQVTFLEFQWNKFEWNFDPVRTTSFRWFTDFHWSTKISEFEVFAVSQSAESLGDNVQILFSADGEIFTTADLLEANTSSASYKLGNSPQFMRIIVRPVLALSINDIKVNFEEDQVCFGEEGRLGSSINIEDARRGTIGEATCLPITNITGQTSDLIVNIPEDIESAKQLLYFNQLNTAEDIVKPQVGPPGRIDFVDDKVLKEETNVAINARAHGLLSTVSGVEAFISDDLAANGDFETGTIAGWNLVITHSGSEEFQKPKVQDFDTYEIDPIQAGDYAFGFVIDNNIPSHFELFTRVAFKIGQTHDISQFAENIDTGSTRLELTFDYAHYGLGPAPTLRIIGAPTISGAEADAGTTISSEYGSNLLHQRTMKRSTDVANMATGNVNYEANFVIKSGTRYVRTEIDIDSQLPDFPFGGSPDRQAFVLDEYTAKINAPATTLAKWYKSYRTGVGDFEESRFEPVRSDQFVVTSGSHHWWQPVIPSNVTGAPTVNHTPGFSNAFTQDRFLGCESFDRMTLGDPGVLAAKWASEKKIAGLRMAAFHETSTTAQEQYPRRFIVETLKSSATLGVEPDIKNDAHWEQQKIFSNVGPYLRPTTLGGNFNTTSGSWSRQITFLLDEPVDTQGLRVLFTRNCDKFEADYFGSPLPLTGGDFTNFNTITTCPDNLFLSTGFFSGRGIAVSMFTPLEAVGHLDLPIDNSRDETESGSNIYVAVDLGRHYDLNVDPDLFELIATTEDQSQFDSLPALFSSEDVDDPNLVAWSGTSSFARWIRFVSPNEQEYEETLDNNVGGETNVLPYVATLPQSILYQARIYPNIQVSNIFLEGFNAAWESLGTILTDNRNDTFIKYSDYPIVAIDLGSPYLLKEDDSIDLLNHDLVSGDPPLLSDDEKYWNPLDDDSFAYAVSEFGSEDNPNFVEFGPFGGDIPDHAVRWVAVRGTFPLTTSQISTIPKTYNFDTPGNFLYNVSFAPRNPQVFTENTSWFTTNRAQLIDVSTFDFTLGIPFSVQEGEDFGASHDNLGEAYNAWDGKFDYTEDDFWGAQVRNVFTGIFDSSLDFPHYIWRVFRDPYRGDIQTKEIKAVKVLGFDDEYYPTDFKIQKLKEGFDPNLDTSWQDIDDASFTGVDTFQNGAGYVHIFPTAISTTGIRIYVTDSVYADDSVTTGVSDTGTGTFTTNPTDSGPQTRIIEVVAYEEDISTAVLEGTLETNHALSASVTSTTNTPDHEAFRLVDNNTRSYFQSTGFTDTITITLPEPKPIDRLVWVQDEQLGRQTGGLSTNAPSSFTLTAEVLGIPVTVLSETDFIGATFSGTLTGAPVTSDTWTFTVSKVQGQNEDASSILFHELRLVEVQNQDVPLIVFEEVFDRRPGSTNIKSTKATYAAGADAAVSIYLDGIDANNDEFFSERDFFSFWVHVNNSTLIDPNFGLIKIGNDSEINYVWNLKDITLNSGWNQIKLQFSDAADRAEIPFEPGAQYDINTGDSQVDFITPDVTVTTNVDGNFSRRVEQTPGIRYFEFQFRGTGASEEIELIFDDMQFIRNKFDDVCKFTPSLYLNNSETFTINLDGVDLAAGTVEFWFQPDWDTAARITGENFILPGIFRIIRPDGRFLSLFYRPSVGFVTMINDGTEVLQFISEVGKYFFEKKDTFHFALTWDALGRIPPQNATLAMYINGEVVFGSNRGWTSIREQGNTVMFGGEVSQTLAVSPHNSTALTFTAVPTLPAGNTASCWALLENIKIYNYAKTDFSDINNRDLERTQLITPSQMIEISKDNVNFYGVGSDNLPLVFDNVDDNEAVNVYIRTNIPRGLTGNESRDASLLVRWKTPLIDCE